MRATSSEAKRGEKLLTETRAKHAGSAGSRPADEAWAWRAGGRAGGRPHLLHFPVTSCRRTSATFPLPYPTLS